MELSEEETNNISNFYILTFSPNPDKDRVKIWIPSSDNFKTIMRRDHFINLISGIVGQEIRFQLTNACNYYGGYFMVDRVNKTVKALSSLREQISYSATALKNAKLGVDTKKSNDTIDGYIKAWSLLQDQFSSFKGF